MGEINWLIVINLLGLSQGVFLAVSFQIIKDKNVKSNRVLSLILIAISSAIGAWIIKNNYYEPWMLRWLMISDTLVLSIAPSIYLYIKILLTEEKISLKQVLFYYSPVILYGVVNVFLIFSSDRFIAELVSSGKLFVIFFIVEICAMAFNYYWIIKSILFISLAKRRFKETLSFTQNSVLFSLGFCYIYLVVVILWSLFFVLKYFFTGIDSYFNYQLVWTFLSFFIFILGYYMIWQPDVFKVRKQIKTTPKRLKEDVIQSIKDRLERLMRDDSLYKNNKLKLADLAISLEVKPHDISWLLNEVYHRNFYDFINSYRIKEFLNKVQTNQLENKTILALATEVGFNSKNSFYNAFKKELGETPSQYIKNKT